MELQPGFVAIARTYQAKSKWSDIAKHIASGNNGYLNVGDVITDKLKNGEKFSVEVVALNPYAQNTVAFVFKDLPERFHMNDTNTNRGGWRDSKMRRHLNEELFAQLPDELQAVIKERTIKQKLNGVVVNTLDKLWLPSRVEVFGGTYESDVDDVQFEWFKKRAHRVKFFDDEVWYWWLRSPASGSSTNFNVVNYIGASANFGANNYTGVAPGFIV